MMSASAMPRVRACARAHLRAGRAYLRPGSSRATHAGPAARTTGPPTWWRRPGPAAVARLLAAVLVAVVATVVSGCGSSSNGVASKSPTDILATATSAAQEASSVHLLASSATGPLTSVLNMQYAPNGAQGHVSLLGLSFGLVRDGDTIYVNGNRRFYRQLGVTLGGSAGAALAKLPVGTYLKGSAVSGPLSQLGAIADKKSELGLILSRGTPVAKGSETTVAGHKVIELKQFAKLYTGSLYIATTGKPYPIEEHKTGRETGHTSFANWDQPVTITAPASSVDVSQLEHHT
jgi:hypothetical protein